MITTSMLMKGGDRIEEIYGALMDWDFREFGWEESTELDPKEDDDDDLVFDFISSGRTTTQKSSSSSTTTTTTTAPSSEGLKLGSTTTMTDPTEQQSLKRPNQVLGDSNLASSPSGSSKRLNGGAQKLSCLVDGCRADLSNCREYHKRHRVCERHSKTPIVVVKGEEKRFCQQCSRFHSLGEFDEIKRSCRKRLDGHNRRRRKSQPEPLYFSSKGFLSGYKGPRILHFGSPQIYAATSVKSLWPMDTKTGGQESWIYSPPLPHKRFQVNQQSPSPTPFNGGDKRVFFLQKNDPKQGNQTYPEAILCHPSEPPGKGREKSHILSSEEISLPIDSGGRALYLLSTNPTQLSGVNQMGQHNESFPYPFQLLDHNDGKDKPLDHHHHLYHHLPAYDVNKSNIYGNMMLRMGPEDCLENGAAAALQMLPISLE
ncbi:teosinte glume architecture 1-like isoform X2 [Humulus lupulus]|uniref:teosinte glume architecture 1-like isoform X2 n=1 Tax=Humulus lupulus TaxID=3486 RepID=UPI002B404749|nr:teosinte glume architecture 1-like isoform X2 [Humulus lupulus]